MNIAVVSLLGVICFLAFISVILLISVLKGIASMLDQRREIFDKHQEWMNDIYDWVYAFKKEEEKMVIGDEESSTKQNEMYENAIQELNSKLDGSDS